MSLLKISFFNLAFLFVSCGQMEPRYETREVEVDRERSFLRCGELADRTCTKEEKAFILDIEYLARKIKNVSEQDDLLSHFHVFKTASSELASKFSILGEDHTDLIGQLDNYSYIEREIKADDVLLLEGYPKDYQIPDCLWSILRHLQCTLEYERKGQTYSPYDRLNFCSPTDSLWNQVEHELKVDFLKLKTAQCRSWDRTDLKFASQLQGLRSRNANLARTMRAVESMPHRVFVVAGHFHSPIGEFQYFAQDKEKAFEAQTLSDLYKYYRDTTSTEDIFNFLRFKSTGYFSHKRLVSNPQLLPRRL